MSIQRIQHSLEIKHQQLTNLIGELTAIDEQLDRPSDRGSHDVRTKSGKAISVRARDDRHLEVLGQRIAAVDAQFQQMIFVGNQPSELEDRFRELFALRDQCQQQFDAVMEKYGSVIPKPKAKAPVKKSLPADIEKQRNERNNAIAERSVVVACGKVELEAARSGNRDLVGATAQSIAKDASETTPLHEFFKTLEGTPQRKAEAWSKIPFATRQQICGELGVESSKNGEIALLVEGFHDIADMQALAQGFCYLSRDERALLISRLQRTEGTEQFLEFARVFEESESEIAELIAARDPADIAPIIGQIVTTTVDRSGLHDATFLDALTTMAERKSQLVVPEESELLAAVATAEQERSCVFARFYNEALYILHQPGTDEDKRRLLGEAMTRLPDDLKNNHLYGKIYALHPGRQPRQGWGERHALDDFGVFLAAVYSLCPPNTSVVAPFIAEMQTVLHKIPALTPQKQQEAVKVILDKVKKECPQEWKAFRGAFYNYFPGAEKSKWGYGGEERVAHKFPHHALLALHSISCVHSRPEYWDGLRAEVRTVGAKQPLVAFDGLRERATLLPEAASESLLRACVLKEKFSEQKAVEASPETVWKCFNAIEHGKQRQALGDLQQHPFFELMWRMSPLCSGLRSGREFTVDEATAGEIQNRLKLLGALDAALKALPATVAPDANVWNTLVHRIILMPEQFSDTELEEFQVLLDALNEAKSPDYAAPVAKEILQMLADMTSKRYVVDGLANLIALKQVKLMACSFPLQGKPLRKIGWVYKDLIVFREGDKEKGRILAKMKTMDPSLVERTSYPVANMYREWFSSQMIDLMALKATAPTAIVQVTLGNSILKLVEMYKIRENLGNDIFASADPLLQEAIKKRLPDWEHATAQEKIVALTDFYERTGTTDLLQVMAEELKKPSPSRNLLNMFKWLPTEARGSVYGELFKIQAPKGPTSLNYGEQAFHNKDKRSSTDAERCRAMESSKYFTTSRGLISDPQDRAEGLGSIQLWQQDVAEVTTLLCTQKDAAQRLRAAPKEWVDLYAITHLMKGHKDSHSGNTLLQNGTGKLIDCDEEHCLPASEDFRHQKMWELGLPASSKPISPLLLHVLRHPHLTESAEGVSHAHELRFERGFYGAGSLRRYYRELNGEFREPIHRMKGRVKHLRESANAVLTGKKAPQSTQDLFFEIYGGKDAYERLVATKALKDKRMVAFEQYAGLDVQQPRPLTAVTKQNERTYWANVKALSQV